MRVTFLIATRDRKEAARRCLASIARQRRADVETIVVDDASSDGTAEMVASEFPSAILLRGEERIGVGSAHALGLENASGEVVVCLDDDAYLVSDDACEQIVARFAAMPKLGALCFRVEAPDGSVRRREIPRRDKRLPVTDEEIAYFLGGAVAYRASALREAGGFASRIGYGSVELDLAFRLFAAGYRTFFTPSVRVVHSAIASPQNSLYREANYARSRIGIAARYLPAPYAQVHASLWIGLCMLDACKRGHTVQTVRGVREGLVDWRRVRATAPRLTAEQVRRLDRLSGRTWY